MRDGVGRVSQKDYTVPTNLQSIVPAVPTVTYGWNKNGQPLSMGNAHGTAAWSYDARNRVATERVGHGPTMSFAYDARSLVVGETAAGQSRLNTSHLYDAAGRRTSTTRDGQTTQFAWDNGYRRTQIALPNGTTQDYAFDQVNRITNIDYKKNGTRFEKYDYSLDAVGNVTALTTLNGNYSYGYDQAYQLTSESRTGLQAYSKSYSYDSEGNRLTMVNGGTTTNYTYNAADQLVSWNEGAKSCAYAYDREGNVIGKTLTDNGTTTDGWDFQYDAANRMDNAVQNAGGTQSLYNTYAGDGWQRVQSVNNGNTMRFGWNGDALLAEFDANGNLTAGYLNDGLDAPLYKTRFSNNGATITGQEFYHQDANGRVHHLTDGQGNIAEKYLYDAFGNQTILGDK
jgi:YD repeat-containing protein